MRVALSALADDHSFYITSGGSFISASTKACFAPPIGGRPPLPATIGYVRIPSFSGSAAEATALAAALLFSGWQLFWFRANIENSFLSLPCGLLALRHFAAHAHTDFAAIGPRVPVIVALCFDPIRSACKHCLEQLATWRLNPTA